MSVATELRCLLLLARGDLTAEEQGSARQLLAQPLAWRVIARLAHEHGVFPAVARNLRRLGWPQVPVEIRKELEASERLNAARNTLLGRGLQGVLERFGRAGIRVIPLKGVALAESLYGDVTLRVCADVDILVPRRAVGPAIELLRADGYESADRYHVDWTEIELLLHSSMEYGLVSPPAALRYPLELHWDIAWRWRADTGMMDDLWADARPGMVLGTDAWTLSPRWELLYLALHAARHRWSALKWLVDIHEACIRGGLDWAGVEDRARRFGLERALHLSLGACRVLLGTPLPPELEGHAPPRRLRVLHSTPVTVGGWREALSAVRLFPRPADKLRYLGRLLLQPALAEWQLVRLPPGLRILYYPLRPLRLALTSSWVMVRAGLGRLL
jgi:hypothetical protein